MNVCHIILLHLCPYQFWKSFKCHRVFRWQDRSSNSFIAFVTVIVFIFALLAQSKTTSLLLHALSVCTVVGISNIPVIRLSRLACQIIPQPSDIWVLDTALVGFIRYHARAIRVLTKPYNATNDILCNQNNSLRHRFAGVVLLIPLHWRQVETREHRCRSLTDSTPLIFNGTPFYISSSSFV